MNMPLRMSAPTPTEAKAADRRRAFREKIAAAASNLERSKAMSAKVVTLGATIKAEAKPLPAATPAPEAPRRDPHWFFIVDVKDMTPRISSIQRAVASYYRISVNDLLSQRRTADVILPRHIAFYLCKELTKKSLPEIGRRSGGRDHTTILHGVRKIRGVVLRDTEIAMDVAILMETITGVQQ